MKQGKQDQKDWKNQTLHRGRFHCVRGPDVRERGDLGKQGKLREHLVSASSGAMSPSQALLPAMTQGAPPPSGQSQDHKDNSRTHKCAQNSSQNVLFGPKNGFLIWTERWTCKAIKAAWMSAHERAQACREGLCLQPAAALMLLIRF